MNEFTPEIKEAVEKIIIIANETANSYAEELLIHLTAHTFVVASYARDENKKDAVELYGVGIASLKAALNYLEAEQKEILDKGDNE